MLSCGNVSHQRLCRFLAFYLAGMNVGLNVHAQLSGSAYGSRRRISDTADNSQGQRTAFEGISKCGVVDNRRAFGGCREEVGEVIVAAPPEVLPSLVGVPALRGEGA